MLIPLRANLMAGPWIEKRTWDVKDELYDAWISEMCHNFMTHGTQDEKDEEDEKEKKLARQIDGDVFYRK